MVSIIYIMLRKNEKLIASLNSITNQTYKDFEIIIIGNSLLDEAELKINKLINKGAPISIYRIDDTKSALYAYLYGAKRAKGQYLAFIESTDYVYESYLEQLMKKIADDSEITIATAGFARHHKAKTYDNFHYKGEVLEGAKKFDIKEISYYRLWDLLVKKELFLDFLNSEDLSSYNQTTLVTGLIIKSPKYYRHGEILYFRGSSGARHHPDIAKNIEAVIKCKEFELPKVIYQNLVIDEILINQSRILLQGEINKAELKNIVDVTRREIGSIRRKIFWMKRSLGYKRAAFALVGKRYEKAKKLLEKLL